MTLPKTLIEQVEQEHDLKTNQFRKRKKNFPYKKRPFPHSQKFPNCARQTGFTSHVASSTFHEKLIRGEKGTFEDLIRFLGDKTEIYGTISLKNHYLKFLKNQPLTQSQADAVRKLIWNYANSNQMHRIRLYSRLAIRVSTSTFHRAFAQAASAENRIFGRKLHQILEALDHHCPETKPTTT